MTRWPLFLGGVSATTAALVWAAYHPASTVFGPTLRRAPSNNTIALTFDDGPNPAITPRLLDLLDRQNARATFFLIGRWAHACPEIVREIAARGHAIGNHTDTHPNLLFLSRRQIVDELLRCQTAIAEMTGTRPSLMRPPYGVRGPQLRAAVEESGLTHVVTWTLIGRDWTRRGSECLQARLNRVRGGDVVVLHDGSHLTLRAGREATLRALEHWLPRWNDAGLHCTALG